jgi:flagellar export protein FliJ
MAAGRYATHLRQCLERERRLMAAAVAQLMRVRERFTAAAREQAVIERLLESRRQEREYERARAERAMHDECAASAYARGLRAGRC